MKPLTGCGIRSVTVTNEQKPKWQGLGSFGKKTNFGSPAHVVKANLNNV